MNGRELTAIRPWTPRKVRRWIWVVVGALWTVPAGASEATCVERPTNGEELVSDLQALIGNCPDGGTLDLLPGVTYELSEACTGCSNYALPDIGDMPLVIRGNNAILRPTPGATGFGLIQATGTRGLVLHNVLVANFSNTASPGDAAIRCNDCQSLSLSDSSFLGNSGNSNSALWITGLDTMEMAVENSQFSNNIALNQGGPIAFRSSGSLRIDKTVFSNNIQEQGTGDSNGGAGVLAVRPGPDVLAPTTVTVTDSNFAHNSATSFGTAIFAVADAGTPGLTLNVDSSTFSFNGTTGRKGGAIFVQGDPGNSRVVLSITNSTFAGNVSPVGSHNAAVFVNNNGSATIAASTFVNNINGALGLIGAGSSLTFQDSILVGPQLCRGAVVSLGNNMIQGEVCGFDATKNDVACSTSEPDTCGLAPLANNGGPTQTIAILPESMAVGNASCTANQCARGRDARGVARSTSSCTSGVSTCDIGAYQRLRQAPCNGEGCTQTIGLYVDFSHPDFATGYPVLNAPGEPDTISCTADVVQWKIIPFGGRMPVDAGRFGIENVFFTVGRLPSIQFGPNQGGGVANQLKEDQSMELCLFQGLPTHNRVPPGATAQEAALWSPNIDGWVLYQIGTSTAQLNQRGSCGTNTNFQNCFPVPSSSDDSVSGPWSYYIVWQGPIAVRELEPRMKAELEGGS